MYKAELFVIADSLKNCYSFVYAVVFVYLLWNFVYIARTIAIIEIALSFISEQYSLNYNQCTLKKCIFIKASF